VTPTPIHADRAFFIDTSACFALIDPGDANRTHAEATLARLEGARAPGCTTNFVLAEFHALVLARLGHRVARRALAALDDGQIGIVRVTLSDERAARDIVAEYEDKAFSLTDAMSFAVMRRLNLSRAFAYDRHFVQFGFALLTPETA
jgi:predicted nucleic acid-binding protein